MAAKAATAANAVRQQEERLREEAVRNAEAGVQLRLDRLKRQFRHYKVMCCCDKRRGRKALARKMCASSL